MTGSWVALRRFTQARIAQGRAGHALPTRAQLEFQLDHAQARDAVRARWDLEAFAAQVLAVIRVLGLDPERINVNGGAIALGHPLGCTGAKLTATLLSEMRRRKVRYGMVTMCVGGGMGAAGIFEMLD